MGLLVERIEDCLGRLRSGGVVLPEGLEAEIEEFPGEGTRELYLPPDPGGARLLLLEPCGEGPYRRALGKRGPGLHHVALEVPDVLAFAIASPGWLAVPASLEGWRRQGTLWLARPGVGTLLEVSPRTEGAADPSPAGGPDAPGASSGGRGLLGVEVPLAGDGDRRLCLGLGDRLRAASGDEAVLVLGEKRLGVGDLVRSALPG